MHSTSPNTNFPTQGGAALDPCQGLCPWIPPGALYRGALNFFLVGVCHEGFQNVGSRERIFFFFKWGSWERKFGKILV